MNVVRTLLPGVLLIEPKVFGDSRGFFVESYNRRRYAESGSTPPSSKTTILDPPAASCAACTIKCGIRRESSFRW